MGRRQGSPPLVNKEVGIYSLSQTYRKADAIDIRMGTSYFTDFQARIARIMDRLHTSLITGCALYAALSPNNSQENNMVDMENAIVKFKSGEWDSFRPTTYGANKAKALRILQGESPDEVISGNKTWNFFHNMLDPMDRNYVTIDGHMVNIWNNKRVPLDWAGISQSQYRMLSSGVREVAGGIGLVPCQLQAVLWLTWRRIHRILYNPQYQLFQGE